MNIDLTSILLFRLFYTLGFAAGIIAMAGCVIALICLILLVSSSDPSNYSYSDKLKNNVEQYNNKLIKYIKISLISVFSLIIISVVTPSRDEYYMFASYKVAEGISKTEIGTKSQEVIINWLDNKLSEIHKSTDNK